MRVDEMTRKQKLKQAMEFRCDIRRWGSDVIQPWAVVVRPRSAPGRFSGTIDWRGRFRSRVCTFATRREAVHALDKIALLPRTVGGRS